MSDNLWRALKREGAVEPTAVGGMRSVSALCQRDILMYDYEGMDRLTRQHQVETQPVAWGVNEDGHRYGVAQPRGSSRHARRLEKEEKEKGTFYFFGANSPPVCYPGRMPRTARASVGDVCYHVINRGNGRAEVFHKDGDYEAAVKLVEAASERLPMRVLAYCFMPNHFHLVLWPRQDGDLSRWMQWFMTSHVRRYHAHYGTSGHVWQGRFKAFPIQKDEHLLTVLRYVERNPKRADLVDRAEAWPWSSLRWWIQANRSDGPRCLHAGPVDRGRRWVAEVNRPMTSAELDALRRCVNRGAPWGRPTWRTRTAARLGLQHALRPRGRPPKKTKK